MNNESKLKKYKNIGIDQPIINCCDGILNKVFINIVYGDGKYYGLSLPDNALYEVDINTGESILLYYLGKKGNWKDYSNIVYHNGYLWCLPRKSNVIKKVKTDLSSIDDIDISKYIFTEMMEHDGKFIYLHDENKDCIWCISIFANLIIRIDLLNDKIEKCYVNMQNEILDRVENACIKNNKIYAINQSGNCVWCYDVEKETSSYISLLDDSKDIKTILDYKEYLIVFPVALDIDIVMIRVSDLSINRINIDEIKHFGKHSVALIDNDNLCTIARSGKDIIKINLINNSIELYELGECNMEYAAFSRINGKMCFRSIGEKSYMFEFDNNENTGRYIQCYESYKKHNKRIAEIYNNTFDKLLKQYDNVIPEEIVGVENFKFLNLHKHTITKATVGKNIHKRI